jgi:hypothetical protein
MFTRARRTLWLGPLLCGLAGCTVQMPAGAAPPPAAKKLPPPLNFYIATGDKADRVQIVSDAKHSPGSAKVHLCLELVGVTWWKGLGVGTTAPTLQVQDNKTSDCVDIAPQQQPITFHKAKAFGAHTRLGNAVLSLEAYAGHKVSVRWSAD